MCKPNKALRMTIKIHIKTEEKKRAAAESATPAIETPAPAPEPPVEKAQAQAQAPASTELVSQDAASGAPDSHDAAAGPGATGSADQLDEVRLIDKLHCRRRLPPLTSPSSPTDSPNPNTPNT